MLHLASESMFLQLTKKRVSVKCVPYFVRKYKNNNHLKIEVILAKRKRVNVSCEKKKSECQSGHMLNVSRPLCMKIQLCQDSILNLALSRLTCIGSLEIRHDVRKNILVNENHSEETARGFCVCEVLAC